MGLLSEVSPDAWQALSLLGAYGAAGQGPQGLLAVNQFLGQAKERAAREKLAELQYRKGLLEVNAMEDDSKTRGLLGQAARDAYVSPDLSRQLSTGPMPDGSAMQGPAPGFDARSFLNQAYSIDPFKAMQYEQSLSKDEKPMVVAQGSSIYDPRKRAFIGQAPQEPAKPPSAVQEYEYAKAQGFPGSFADWELTKRRAGATSVSVNTDNLGLKPKDRFEMEGKLADDYMKATEQDRKILSAVSKIKTALGQDGALKDQAAIYAFAKTLDPEGAVRESDYAAIANSAGLIDRVRSYADKLLKGEKLSPQQRQEMIALGTAWEKVAEARIGPQRSRFATQAQRYNLRPDAILDPGNGTGGWSITPVK